MTKEELAIEYKHNKCNCCQAVARSLVKRPMRAKKLMALGSGFGSGMGCTEGNCGALVGAVMAAGLNGKGKAARYIYRSFKELTGATVCAELKGKTGKEPVPCDDCVRLAVRAYEKGIDDFNNMKGKGKQ